MYLCFHSFHNDSNSYKFASSHRLRPHHQIYRHRHRQTHLFSLRCLLLSSNSGISPAGYSYCCLLFWASIFLLFRARIWIFGDRSRRQCGYRFIPFAVFHSKTISSLWRLEKQTSSEDCFQYRYCNCGDRSRSYLIIYFSPNDRDDDVACDGEGIVFSSIILSYWVNGALALASGIVTWIAYCKDKHRSKYQSIFECLTASFLAALYLAALFIATLTEDCDIQHQCRVALATFPALLTLHVLTFHLIKTVFAKKYTSGIRRIII